MSVAVPSTNDATSKALFARLAAFSFRRRRGVIALWLVVAFAAAPLALSLTSALSGAGWEAQGSTAQQVRDELRRDPHLQPDVQPGGDDRRGRLAGTDVRSDAALREGGSANRFLTWGGASAPPVGRAVKARPTTHSSRFTWRASLSSRSATKRVWRR